MTIIGIFDQVRIFLITSTPSISGSPKSKRTISGLCDDGDGIPDEMKARVFDMFYSGANKIADSRRSLGLGLSLCRSIVNAHGGKITVSDNTPHGTVFTITLSAREVEIHE
jgi:two-component system, OmpR family, sensor histidine kinase KdpD